MTFVKIHDKQKLFLGIPNLMKLSQFYWVLFDDVFIEKWKKKLKRIYSSDKIMHSTNLNLCFY